MALIPPGRCCRLLQPNMTLATVVYGPVQILPCKAKLGLPKRLRNRISAKAWTLRRVPLRPTRVSAPYLSFSSCSLAAISSKACYHEIICHFPSPLSPALFSGKLTRSGWYMNSLALRLLIQFLARGNKVSNPGSELSSSTLISRPFSVCTNTGQ